MKKWRKELSTMIGAGCIVRVGRGPKIDDVIDGYVVGLSKQFVMLHQVDTDYVDLNGYIVLRTDDITGYRIREADDCFIHRALRLKGKSPVPQPQIDLSDPLALLISAGSHFPLLNIACELKAPDSCYIGRVQKLTAKTLTLDQISPAAHWDDTRRHKLKDITRIEFGGAYEAALALVAAHDAATQDSITQDSITQDAAT